MSENTNKKKKSIFKRVLIWFGILVLIILLLALLLGAYIYITNKDDIYKCIRQGYEKVENISEDTFNSRYPTQFFDANNNLIKEFKTIEYVYKPYEEINPNVFNALISVEDKRFYEHNGVDFKGLMRAGVKLITSGGKVVQGGSTITQQLAKNVFLTMDRTMFRKLEEMVIATELEKKYSKEDILEFYVNNINYGNGAYSIESASQYYFQKDTNSLTIPEIALLTGIPNNPTLYNPIKNPQNAKDRRNIILDKMFECGYITEEEKNNYQNEEVNLNVKNITIDNSVNGYDLNFAVDKAVEEIMKMNGFQFRYSFQNEEDRNTYYDKYSEKYDEARNELMTGGYRVETSINKELQDKLQEITDEKMKEYKEINKDNGLYMKQSASTLIDNTTGEVVAIVGGRTQQGNDFNRASLGYRQPGSAIKPLLSYTPNFENGLSPEDIVEDKKTDNVHNYYSGYKGNVTVRYAVEDSINTVAYNLISKVGVDKALDYLKAMQFKYIMPQDNNPIVAVGGFTKGATTTEMASGFSTLSRNGKFISPTNVRKIVKRSNETTLYEITHKQTKVYDEGASYIMTDVLKGVINSEHGTGHVAKIDGYENHAGKTGSTDDFKDSWIVGYTKYYTLATWVGDDTPKPQYGNASSKTSKWIYKDMMTYLHEGKEDLPFDKPDSVYTDDNGALRVKHTGIDAEQQKRNEKEEQRKLKEITSQQERIGEEEYRIKYGLSEEEELLREMETSKLIDDLANYNLTSSSQERELKELIRNARNRLDDVKRKSAHDELQAKLNENIKTLTDKLDSIYRAEREEQDRLNKQREEEEKRKEEELIKQEQQKEEQQKEEGNSNKHENDNKEDNKTDGDIKDNPPTSNNKKPKGM